MYVRMSACNLNLLAGLVHFLMMYKSPNSRARNGGKEGGEVKKKGGTGGEGKVWKNSREGGGEC